MVFAQPKEIMDCFTNFDKISGCEMVVEFAKNSQKLEEGDKFSLFYRGYNSEIHFLVTKYIESDFPDYWTRKAYMYKCFPDSIKFEQETKMIPVEENYCIVEFTHIYDVEITPEMHDMFKEHKQIILQAIKYHSELKNKQNKEIK